MDDAFRRIALLRQADLSLEERDRIIAELVEIGEAAVPPLIVALDEGYFLQRLRAARALGQMGDVRAVRPLLTALRRATPDDLDMAQTILESLTTLATTFGERGDAHAIEPLIEILRATRFISSDQGPGPAAARALGKIADKDPVPELRAALPFLRLPVFLVQPVPELDYRKVYRKIQEATAAFKDLPMPSAKPLPGREDLPVPADSPAASPDSLPIPAGRGAEATATRGRRWWTLPGWWGRLWRLFRRR